MIDFGSGMDWFWGIAGIVGGIAAIVALVWVGASGHRDRDAEDDARVFFDRHGRWPDEEPAAEHAEPGRPS